MKAPSPPPDADAAATEAPHSLGDLFVSLSLLALQGFGGVVAVVQRELVERRRWLTREEFLQEWGAAQIMPGPSIVNLCVIIGMRHFGLAGAVTAVCGLIAAPMLVVLTLGLLYSEFGHSARVAGALRGMGAVAAGVITATALRLMGALRQHPAGLAVCAVLGTITFVAIALLRLPLVFVLFTLAALACGLTWRALAARERT